MLPFDSTELAAMTSHVSSTLGTASGIGVSVTIARGATILAAQSARIVSPISANETRLDAGSAAVAQAYLVGAPDMNVAKGDRFKVSGVNYNVVAVRPNRTVETLATIEAVHP